MRWPAGRRGQRVLAACRWRSHRTRNPPRTHLPRSTDLPLSTHLQLSTGRSVAGHADRPRRARNALRNGARNRLRGPAADRLRTGRPHTSSPHTGRARTAPRHARKLVGFVDHRLEQHDPARGSGADRLCPAITRSESVRDKPPPPAADAEGSTPLAAAFRPADAGTSTGQVGQRRGRGGIRRQRGQGGAQEARIGRREWSFRR